MRTWKIDTIGDFLRVFTLLFILLPSVLMIAVACYELQGIKQEKMAYLESIIGMQRKMIDDSLDEQASHIKSIAQLDFVRHHDKDRMNSNFAVLFRNQSAFSTIAYINKKGIIEASSPPIVGQNVADRTYFQQALQGKDYISDVIASRAEGQLMVVFASPVYDFSGEIQGVIYGSVRMTTINNIMEHFKFGSTGKTYLVNQQSQKIQESYTTDMLIDNAHSNLEGRINSQGIELALQGKSGSASYVDYRGEKVFGVYQWMARTQWAIIGEMNENEILEPFYRHLRYLVIIYLFVLSFFLPLNFLIYRKILSPIKVLVKGLQAITQGIYNYSIDKKIIDIAFREVQQLCELFSRMASTIQGNIETLNKTNTFLVYAENRYRNLVENSLVGVYIVKDGIFTYVNPRFAEMFGYTPEEILGIKTVDELTLPSDWHDVCKNMQFRLSGEIESITYEFRGVKKDGSMIHLLVYGTVCKADEEIHINGTLIDITEQKFMEERLRYFSFHDQLTGLYNRNYLEEAIDHIKRERYTSLGVFALDVDGLKVTNDTLGHQQGDLLLKQAATLLKKCLGASDIIIRMGGDEFIVLLPGISRGDIEKNWRKIYEEVELFNQGKPAIRLSMSVGFAFTEEMPADLDELFYEADANMYQEKIQRHGME